MLKKILESLSNNVIAYIEDDEFIISDGKTSQIVNFGNLETYLEKLLKGDFKGDNRIGGVDYTKLNYLILKNNKVYKDDKEIFKFAYIKELKNFIKNYYNLKV